MSPGLVVNRVEQGGQATGVADVLGIEIVDARGQSITMTLQLHPGRVTRTARLQQPETVKRSTAVRLNEALSASPPSLLEVHV